MTDKKITDLGAQTGTGLAVGDLFETVDISDTTMASTGTNKKITGTNLANGLIAILGAPQGPYDPTAVTPENIWNALIALGLGS